MRNKLPLILSVSFFPSVHRIAVLIVAPRPVPTQICQQQVTGLLELIAVKTQANQPDPEGEQLVVAAGFLHDGTPLDNGLCGHGEAQMHISRRLGGVQGRIEAPPFDGASVKDGVEVQGIVAGFVVMAIPVISISTPKHCSFMPIMPLSPSGVPDPRPGYGGQWLQLH